MDWRGLATVAGLTQTHTLSRIQGVAWAHAESSTVYHLSSRKPLIRDRKLRTNRVGNPEQTTRGEPEIKNKQHARALKYLC